MRKGTRRQELYAATRPVHDRLDETVGALDDLAAYRAYLGSTMRFRSGVEAALDAAAWPEAWTWRPVLVGRHLMVDAADLDVEVPMRSVRIATPSDVSALIGILYVIEGSSLGAKILRRRAARLGLRDDFGARHLALMAAGAGWPIFLALLEECPEFDLSHAVASATATFVAALDSFVSETRVAA